MEVGFAIHDQRDGILERFGDRQMIGEMEKVFFADGPNALGHSYAGLMRGPGGRNDLRDIVDLLRAEPWTKRAVLTLCGPPNGKVPCVNVVQFLVRGGALRLMYFARGQDMFRKFYADGLCVCAMARSVAGDLGLPPGRVTGLIGSAHLYHQDMPAVRRVLEEGAEYLQTSNHGEGPNSAAFATGISP